MSLIRSRKIQQSKLLIKAPLITHLYIAPFVPVYLSVLYLYLFEHEHYFSAEESGIIMFGLPFAINMLVYLSCHWSRKFDAFCSYRTSLDTSRATHVLIIAKKSQGTDEICPVRRQIKRRIAADGDSIQMETFLTFEYQKKKYTFNSDKKQFQSLSYPVSQPIKDYMSAAGLDTDGFDKARESFGLNRFDIPIPLFMDLFKEHAVAPFFVFQVFCVSLWFMDEYWYYSLFTLFMLFLFESTLVFQRLRNLNELRSMAQAPYDIMVYRNERWETVTCDNLLPGDLVSVVRQKNGDVTVPCDILLIGGDCVVNEAMLSGESTPLMKESVFSCEDVDAILDIKSPEFKGNVLFGGTKVLQTFANDNSNVPKPSDEGITGYVLKTGFSTSQGKLVRSMVFSSERVTANNWEAFLFIAVLLCFAIVASGYVWQVGIVAGRKKSKLILDCIIILTSVVPPELPLELSMAVNQSLMALSKLAIFCLEPFRIPIAGKIDVCCFDKTGTLTTDKLVLQGIAGADDHYQTLRGSGSLGQNTVFGLASCHSLVQVENEVVGDPLEVILMNAIGWSFSGRNVTEGTFATKDGKRTSSRIEIVKRFQFSSALKRMASVSTVRDSSKYFVAVKGAPEILRGMLKTVPSKYEEAFTHYFKNGYRVLSLAVKWVDRNDFKIDSMKREAVECDLEFAGFLVFQCPLKKDTKLSIKELQLSSHRIIMITGDNQLTACHVAKELNIVNKPIIILDSNGNNLVNCVDVDGRSIAKVSKDELDDKRVNIVAKLEKLSLTYDFCMTGSALDILIGSPVFGTILVHKCWIYARVSPTQKEAVLLELKEVGYNTLMCGDGTNDVGALKRADIGVALLDGTPEDLEKIAKVMRQRRLLEMKQKQADMMKKWGVDENHPSFKQARNPMMDKMMEDMDMEAPVLKFGDASAAAPFTSKLNTIQSVNNIIRQGRCTLVTTIQMYKILALNCLINAFSLSALYLDNIKHGDTQMTLQGFLISACFMFLSWAKPIQKLSPERPQRNLFNSYILLSIIGQFLVHVSILWAIVVEAKLHLPADWKVDWDNNQFKPNVLSSAVYLISMTMQISTFMINYEGAPFRESLRENRPLFMSLTGLFLMVVFSAGQVIPELNEWLEIVPMSTTFSESLVKAMLLDLGACYIIDTLLKKVLADYSPRTSLDLDSQDSEAPVVPKKYIDMLN